MGSWQKCCMEISGEIPELQFSTPSVPEQEADFFRKRTNTESQGSDSNPS